MNTRSSGWKRSIVALILFGVAFGYVEAAVVVYLRSLNEPVRRRFYPGRALDEVFPLLTVEQMRASSPESPRLLEIEIGREASTLVMLAAFAIGVGASVTEWTGGFCVAFGAWDIFFYVFLRLLLGWPKSLGTWDVLFLIPVPWAAPVLAPVLVSLTMVGAGSVALRRERMARHLRLSAGHWLGILAGGVIILIAFTWDFRNIASGGTPRPFNWPLFALGGALGLGTFLHAAWRRESRSVTGITARTGFSHLALNC